jgi:hypothetical protein
MRARERAMQRGDKRRNRSGLMSKREAQENETEHVKREVGKKRIHLFLKLDDECNDDRQFHLLPVTMLMLGKENNTLQ